MDRDEALRIQKAFGDRVRAVRLKQGISQERLALLSDLNRSYLGTVERGERNISLINICKITKTLKVPPSTLLE